eukprot:521874_1
MKQSLYLITSMLSLLLQIGCSANISNESVVLPKDTQKYIISFIPDKNRLENIQLVSSAYRNLTNEMYKDEIDAIKQHLSDAQLNNNNTQYYCKQIHSMVSKHRNDLYFRKKIDQELPFILTHLNEQKLSLASVRALLNAININVNTSLINNHVTTTCVSERLEITSLQLVLSYFNQFNQSGFNHPFGIITNLCHYNQMLNLLLKSSRYLNETVTTNTVIWDQQTIDMILRDVIERNNGTWYIYDFLRDVTYRRFVEKFTPVDIQYGSKYPIVKYAEDRFRLELILMIVQIDENQDNNMKFRLTHNDIGACNELQLRNLIDSVVRWIHGYYKSHPDTETVNKLIRSLSTVFFDKDGLKIILEGHPNSDAFISRLLTELIHLRSDWNRMSLGDMIGFNCSPLPRSVIIIVCIIWQITLYIFLVVILWAIWCGVVMMTLVIMMIFICVIRDVMGIVTDVGGPLVGILSSHLEELRKFWHYWLCLCCVLGLLTAILNINTIYLVTTPKYSIWYTNGKSNK